MNVCFAIKDKKGNICYSEKFDMDCIPRVGEEISLEGFSDRKQKEFYDSYAIVKSIVWRPFEESQCATILLTKEVK